MPGLNIYFMNVLQLMYHLHQLFAHADGVSLGYEYDTVEGIGDDENRKLAGIL